MAQNCLATIMLCFLWYNVLIFHLLLFYYIFMSNLPFFIHNRKIHDHPKHFQNVDLIYVCFAEKFAYYLNPAAPRGSGWDRSMMHCYGQLSPQHDDCAFTFIAPSGFLAKGLTHMLGYALCLMLLPSHYIYIYIYMLNA